MVQLVRDKDGKTVMADDTRLRIKCAALSFASDHGPVSAASRGDDAAQETLADNLISKLRQAGLMIVKTPKT